MFVRSQRTKTQKRSWLVRWTYGLEYYTFEKFTLFDLLRSIIPADVRNSLELISNAGHCDCNDGKILN
jgi:hypothetical protein